MTERSGGGLSGEAGECVREAARGATAAPTPTAPEPEEMHDRLDRIADAISECRAVIAELGEAISELVGRP